MATSARPLTRARRATVGVVIAIATVLLLVGTATIWVNRQMLDNNAWRNASARLIQDPQVQSALSVYAVNQLYANVDVPAALAQRLPPNLKHLGPPAAAALRQPAANAVVFMLGRPRIQQLWIRASTGAQQRLVNVLENRTGHGISTGNGVVTLDVHELVVELGTELGLPQSALARLPASSGRIVVMRSSQLGAAQTGVRLVRVLSVWLLVAVIGLYALAVVLARGARRTTLRTIGWCFLLVGILALVARKLLGNEVIHTLTTPTTSGAGRRVWLIETSILGDIAWALVLYGAVVIVAAAVAGPTRLAHRLRALIAPVLVDRQGVAWAVAALAYLLIVLWGGTHALRVWWGILLFGALLAAGLVALRKQTEAEVGARRLGPLAATAEGPLPDGLAPDGAPHESFRATVTRLTRSARSVPRADGTTAPPPTHPEERGRP